MNGYNFTEELRGVFALAREEAVRRNHEYVGTEHLLLGLISQSDGVVGAVLHNLDLNAEKIRGTIDQTIKTGTATSLMGHDLPFTSRAKKTMELSMLEVQDLDDDYVGTQHLLLGLIREEKGIAAQVLAQAGLSLGKARAEVRRLTGKESVASVPGLPESVVGVLVEVRSADGSAVRMNFPDVAAAVEFLKDQ